MSRELIKQRIVYHLKKQAEGMSDIADIIPFIGGTRQALQGSANMELGLERFLGGDFLNGVGQGLRGAAEAITSPLAPLRGVAATVGNFTKNDFLKSMSLDNTSLGIGKDKK